MASPALRRFGILALVLAAACEQRAPIPVTCVPQPASAGTPKQQVARCAAAGTEDAWRRGAMANAFTGAGPTPDR